MAIRQQILRQLAYRKSDPKMAEVIFKGFQALPFADKVSETGMIYLISAWSQQQANKELLRRAISFLERGKGKLIHLGPLYRFALERYGTNFSTLLPLGRQNQDKAKKDKTNQALNIKEPPARPAALSDEQIIKQKLKEGKKWKLVEPETLYLD